MQLPDDTGQQGWVAVWLTAILGALGIAWKSWFNVRKDARDDRRGELGVRREETVNETYEVIIDTLREQLEDERDRRRKAEAEVIELRRELMRLKSDGL